MYLIYKDVAICSGKIIKKRPRVRKKVIFVLLLCYIYYL